MPLWLFVDKMAAEIRLESVMRPKADSIDRAAGIEEIHKAPIDNVLMGPHRRLESGRQGHGVAIPKRRLISSYRLADHARLKD